MIHVLPPEVVNQIAAGEVIERPFSVVKELVENSLDAGARRVHVELKDGGRSLVRVTDDGDGFSPDDLRLAFTSHATSKLGALADLDHIASLGFRGEALASIGSVSRARIQSRTPDAAHGAEITCEGGTVSDVRPCGCPVGAVIEIRDLFWNTPARRRFLKGAQAERAKAEELMVRLALAHPDVDFTLVADGRAVLRLPSGEPLRERVARCFGRELAASLQEVAHEDDGYRVEGFVAHPDHARRDSTLEWLWVNGRAARDRSSVHAVRQAMREHLMPGRFPVYFLMLSMPPNEVDVNVHPTKAEVRFVNARKANAVLYEATRRALADVGRGRGFAAVGAPRPVPRTGFPDLPADLFGRPVAGAAAAPATSGSSPAAGWGAPTLAQSAPTAAMPTAAASPVPGGGVREAAHPFRGLRRGRVLQVLDLYLVLEGNDGIVVVDQHALHERVLYERFKQRHAARGAAAVQRLLVPEVVELVPSDKRYVLESRDALAAEGFLVEDFGGHAIAVHGLPALLGKANPRAVLLGFLRGDEESRPDPAAAVAERFHSMACRAAVMSGDRLTQEEMLALLEEAGTLEHPHNCPHGRPTVLTIARAELERWFKRRV